MIYIIAIATGIMVNITPILNGENALKIGTLRTSFNHFLFAVLTGIVAFIILSPLSDLDKIRHISPVFLSGGFIGLFVVMLMNYYASRLEALYVAVLPFLGQMSMGLLLDYFVFDFFELTKVIGLVIVVLGIFIAKAPDSFFKKLKTT